jgi:glycyl-tRNA synthetase
MQAVVLALTEYWASRGCMIVQPFNTEVGAGTLNPATALRVLGPEPWRVAYPEPSVRPDDSRYGENPNRLQTFVQFQVILKPEPGDPQQLYLDSLTALGIDIGAHDVRFVEDNWASPALGAWGLGWEVWLDGLEITQFTYFQQAGGLSLDPVSVEITYGIERITMALQRVSRVMDVEYAPGISFGEAFGQAEYEMSRYYLDEADIGATQLLFGEYAAEADRLLAARLPVPAHYQLLKCSHTFNVLDARGAVSTTERAAAFARMRRLSAQVAALWCERRAELGHPLGLSVAPPAAPVPAIPGPAGPSASAQAGPAPMVLEVGVEELPAAEVTRGAAVLRDAVAAALTATRLGHGDVRGYGTPRRLIVTVADVQPQEGDLTSVVRGPRASAAFGSDGAPTAAALGFARAQCVDVAELQRLEQDGREYVAVSKTEPGRAAFAVLGELLAGVIAGLRADQNMRWNDPELSYSRPIRWLLALLGDDVLPLAVSTLAAGRTTRGYLTGGPATAEVGSAAEFPSVLAGLGVVMDPVQRRAQVAVAAAELAASAGGAFDADGEAGLLDEIAGLVERPVPVLGSFDSRYLALPAEVLTTVMRKHQRYLPVRTPGGDLLPHFIAVANGDCDPAVVRAGNEAVLVARYADAEFFWNADRQVEPEKMREGLAKLAFTESLGSMADRADRIGGIARLLASGHDGVVVQAGDLATVERAARLAKFDLASQLVTELTSLAGTMAGEYARLHGETPAVATALAEMEQPRAAGDELPGSVPGAVLAAADRLDLLAGLFCAGASPTGSSDPFGLRRAAVGLLRILRSVPALRQLTLRAGLDAAASELRRQGLPADQAGIEAAHSFVLRRLEQQLAEQGFPHQHIAAVLPLADRPAVAGEAIGELAKLAGDPQFAALAAALQRARRIVPAGTVPGGHQDRLAEPAELALRHEIDRVSAALPAEPGLAEFAELAAPLAGPVNSFFDQVMVMADDPEVRAARLGQLARICALADKVLDWAALGTGSDRPPGRL